MAFFIFALLFWVMFFLVGNLLERRYFTNKKDTGSPYYSVSNCSANVLHAFVLLVCAMIGVLEMNVGGGLSEFQRLFIIFGLCFYIVDTAVLFLMKHNRADTLLHHLIVVVPMSSSLYFENWGWLTAVYAFTGEWGILIHVEGLLKVLGKFTNRVREKFDITHLGLFIVSRVPLTMVATYFCLMDNTLPSYMKVLAGLYLLLSLYWSVEVFRRYIRRNPESVLALGSVPLIFSRSRV